MGFTELIEIWEPRLPPWWRCPERQQRSQTRESILDHLVSGRFCARQALAYS